MTESRTARNKSDSWIIVVAVVSWLSVLAVYIWLFRIQRELGMGGPAE